MRTLVKINDKLIPAYLILFISGFYGRAFIIEKLNCEIPQAQYSFCNLHDTIKP